MADKSIDQLNEAEKIYATDLFVLQQSGSAKKLPGQVLLNWLTAAADGHGGIQSIAKLSTSGLVNTYRITLADTTIFDFAVNNGRGITGISKTSTAGLVDTYTISYNDGTTSTLTVKNGEKGDKGDNTYTWIKYASQEPTESSHSMGDIPDDWIGIYFGNASTAPSDWKQYKWYKIKGDKGATGAPATLVSRSVTYQVGDSGKVVPSGAWASAIPDTPQGKYLWTKTVVQFNSGDPVTSYTAARQGRDGSGAVSTVCGVEPDSSANINLTAMNVGALPTSGGTMTGAINMDGQSIYGLNAPTEDTQAANKGYVDTNKVDKANVVNNFATTEEGFVADARALKTLNDSKLSMELLWENDSPNSEFAEQEIPLPTLSNYKMIAVETARGTFYRNNAVGYCYMSAAVSWDVYSATLTSRAAEIRSSSILFMSGYTVNVLNGTVQKRDSEFVPAKIYGIKGV